MGVFLDLEYLEKSNSDMDFTLHTGRKIPASRIAFRTRTNFSIGMKMSQRAPSLKAFDKSEYETQNVAKIDPSCEKSKDY